MTRHTNRYPGSTGLALTQSAGPPMGPPLTRPAHRPVLGGDVTPCCARSPILDSLESHISATFHYGATAQAGVPGLAAAIARYRGRRDYPIAPLGSVVRLPDSAALLDGLEAALTRCSTVQAVRAAFLHAPPRWAETAHPRRSAPRQPSEEV